MERSFTLLLFIAGLFSASAQNIDVAVQFPELQAIYGDIEAAPTQDGGTVMAFCRASGTEDITLEVLKTDLMGVVSWNRSIDLRSGALEDLDYTMVCSVKPIGSDVLVLVSGYTNNSITAPAWNLVRLSNDGTVQRVVRVYYPSSEELVAEYNYSSTFLVRDNGHVLMNISSVDRVILTELDESLAEVWSHSFVATEDSSYEKEPSFDIQFTSDSGCIIVGKDRDWPYLMKVDVQGNAEWCNSYVGLGAYSHWRYIRPLPNGEMIVLGATDSQALIARFDADGNMLSCSSINGLGYVDNVVDLPDGSYMVDDGGTFYVRVAQDGTILGSWSVTYGVLPFHSHAQNGQIVRTFTMTNDWVSFYACMASTSFSNPIGCSTGVSLNASASPMPWVTAFPPTAGFIQYAEPVELMDMPVLSSLSELNIVSACGLFVGVAEVERPNAHLFPVPVRSGAALQVELAGVQGTTTFQVLDPLGRTVVQGSGGPGPLLTIPTHGLVAGAYLLRVTSRDQALAAQRFVVE